MRFSTELCDGLSRSQEKFVAQMLFGIQASQDVKLSNIARTLNEEIPLIKPEYRLSHNLKAVELVAVNNKVKAGQYFRGKVGQ